MAKTIKFNLICDEKPVRTLEDLQNNFSIEDILAYYDNKLLHRWLDVRGYLNELEKVSDISSNNHLEIIKELIKIFNVTYNEKKVEETVYILEYLEERKQLIKKYNEDNYISEKIINDYKKRYATLILGIINNPNDIGLIKANILEITENYKWALDLNHRELFWALRYKSVLAIMCLLMNTHSRSYYLPINKSTAKQLSETIVDSVKSITNFASYLFQLSNYQNEIVSPNERKGLLIKNEEDIDEQMNEDKALMYQEICNIIQETDFIEKISGNLFSFSGITDGYWKDLEPRGRYFMIISMGEGDYVRSAGVSGGDLSSLDVTNKFVIVDGIDYKSNSSTRKLLYMEV